MARQRGSNASTRARRLYDSEGELLCFIGEVRAAELKAQKQVVEVRELCGETIAVTGYRLKEKPVVPSFSEMDAAAITDHVMELNGWGRLVQRDNLRRLSRAERVAIQKVACYGRSPVSDRIVTETV